VAQMAEVRLRFTTHPLDLRADMFGTADIVVQQHDGLLLVPDAAVLRDDENGEHTIVEAVGDTLAIARQVQTGIETSDTGEIRGPAVHAGMHVVVAGHYGLPDSTRIRVAGMQPDDSLAAPRRTTER